MLELFFFHEDAKKYGKYSEHARGYLIVLPMLLPTALLVVRRRCLIVLPRPLPAALLVVRRR
jgi:hypothetical protein